MANNGTEIELKFSLEQNAFLRIKDKLDTTSKFVKSSHQIDHYFTPAHRNFLHPELPFEWLSIRQRNGSFALNYKHFYPENSDVYTYCEEIETEIGNLEQFYKIWDNLNFKKLVTVEKERRIYLHEDKFEIGLDTVKDLGYFLEVEAITNFGSVEFTREKLFEFSKTLGVDASEIDNKGYPSLLLKKSLVE